MFQRLFGRGKEERVFDAASWPHSRFCFVDWHRDTGTAAIYHLNTPTPEEPNRGQKSRRLDQKQWEKFTRDLKAEGWQEFISAPNAEGWWTFYMRPLPAESGYEQCVLTAVQWIEGQQANAPLREGLYRLGERNESLLGVDAWKTGYTDSVRMLEGEGWELLRVEEFPYFGPKSRRIHRLSFYRRPLTRRGRNG